MAWHVSKQIRLSQHKVTSKPRAHWAHWPHWPDLTCQLLCDFMLRHQGICRFAQPCVKGLLWTLPGIPKDTLNMTVESHLQFLLILKSQNVIMSWCDVMFPPIFRTLLYFLKLCRLRPWHPKTRRRSSWVRCAASSMVSALIWASCTGKTTFPQDAWTKTTAQQLCIKRLTPSWKQTYN